MKPIDFRNATFESLRKDLSILCHTVYEAWRQHGPGTTREVAAKAGIDLLTFRPRTTDLFQCGAVTLLGGERDGHEGIYQARDINQWAAWFAHQKQTAASNQMQLI